MQEEERKSGFKNGLEVYQEQKVKETDEKKEKEEEHIKGYYERGRDDEPKPEAAEVGATATPEQIEEVKKKKALTETDKIYELTDMKDEQQMITELQGRFLKEYVYHFPRKGGGTVTGLSWIGVKEVVRQVGNLTVEDVIITETEDTYRAKAKAKDIARNVTMFGFAEQSKTMTLKDESVVRDSYALNKCTSKAQRNSLRALIPETVVKSMITEFMKRKNL